MGFFLHLSCYRLIENWFAGQFVYTFPSVCFDDLRRSIIFPPFSRCRRLKQNNVHSLVSDANTFAAWTRYFLLAVRVGGFICSVVNLMSLKLSRVIFEYSLRIFEFFYFVKLIVCEFSCMRAPKNCRNVSRIRIKCKRENTLEYSKRFSERVKLKISLEKRAWKSMHLTLLWLPLSWSLLMNVATFCHGDLWALELTLVQLSTASSRVCLVLSDVPWIGIHRLRKGVAWRKKFVNKMNETTDERKADS